MYRCHKRKEGGGKKKRFQSSSGVPRPRQKSQSDMGRGRVALYIVLTHSPHSGEAGPAGPAWWRLKQRCFLPLHPWLTIPLAALWPQSPWLLRRRRFNWHYVGLSIHCTPFCPTPTLLSPSLSGHSPLLLSSAAPWSQPVVVHSVALLQLIADPYPHPLNFPQSPPPLLLGRSLCDALSSRRFSGWQLNKNSFLPSSIFPFPSVPKLVCLTRPHIRPWSERALTGDLPSESNKSYESLAKLKLPPARPGGDAEQEFWAKKTPWPYGDFAVDWSRRGSDPLLAKPWINLMVCDHQLLIVSNRTRQYEVRL